MVKIWKDPWHSIFNFLVCLWSFRIFYLKLVTQSRTNEVRKITDFVSRSPLFQYQCLCKPNVVGRTCDRCMHGFYNFSASNPLGCSSCGCSPRGTVSETRHCHMQSGRCDCKNHVIGKKCQNCQDGYHGMKSQDIFGCKGEMVI